MPFDENGNLVVNSESPVVELPSGVFAKNVKLVEGSSALYSPCTIFVQSIDDDMTRWIDDYFRRVFKYFFNSKALILAPKRKTFYRAYEVLLRDLRRHQVINTPRVFERSNIRWTTDYRDLDGLLIAALLIGGGKTNPHEGSLFNYRGDIQKITDADILNIVEARFKLELKNKKNFRKHISRINAMPIETAADWGAMIAYDTSTGWYSVEDAIRDVWGGEPDSSPASDSS